MKHPRVLALVLAGGKGSRIEDAWVVPQYRSSSLDQVIAHGRPWDLDRSRGGLRLLHPQEGLGEHEDGMASGNSDSLFRFRELIAEVEPDVVLVLSADHVYRMDFRDVVAAHLENEAECTIVTTDFFVEEAGNHTLVHFHGESSRGKGASSARNGSKVTSIEQKPEQAGTNVVATEVFCYEPQVLIDTLTELFDASPKTSTCPTSVKTCCPP